MRRRSEFNWMELLEGVLLILLGIFSFIRPGSALTGVVILYGFIAMITGIVDIVLYVRIERHTGFGQRYRWYLVYSALWQVLCFCAILMQVHGFLPY